MTRRSCCFSPRWRIYIPRATPWLSRRCGITPRCPPAERAEAAILESCRWLSRTQAFVFIENDAEFLLRSLPQEVKSAHYHDDEVHIRALLEGSGLQSKGGMALAAATVRGLILTVSHQEQIGELYPKVLETLVCGACRGLF